MLSKVLRKWGEKGVWRSRNSHDLEGVSMIQDFLIKGLTYKLSKVNESQSSFLYPPFWSYIFVSRWRSDTNTTFLISFFKVVHNFYRGEDTRSRSCITEETRLRWDSRTLNIPITRKTRLMNFFFVRKKILCVRTWSRRSTHLCRSRPKVRGYVRELETNNVFYELRDVVGKSFLKSSR